MLQEIYSEVPNCRGVGIGGGLETLEEINKKGSE